MAEMYKVKLTVLKTEIYPELAEKYLSIGKELKPCGGFKEGQEIIVDAFMNCPEGFCARPGPRSIHRCLLSAAAVPMRHGQKRMVWKSAAVQTASDR